MDRLIAVLGEPILDPDEEAFLLFSQPIPSQNLGFVDPKAELVPITIGERDYEIRQSPAVLQSNREGGTTGAVIWKVTPLFAAWIASASNFLRTTGILGADATAVELGTGISGLVALSLAPSISRYVATDQTYALKLLRQNVSDNATAAGRKRPAGRKKDPKRAKDAGTGTDRIAVTELDWQTDDVLSLRSHLDGAEPIVDVVIACDCVYNEPLVESFVSTCADICARYQPSSEKPVVCVIAQQLRSPDVFETWLREFSKAFIVWRAPDELLTVGLREGQGFVIHVGVLREQVNTVDDG